MATSYACLTPNVVTSSASFGIQVNRFVPIRIWLVRHDGCSRRANRARLVHINRLIFTNFIKTSWSLANVFIDRLNTTSQNQLPYHRYRLSQNLYHSDGILLSTYFAITNQATVWSGQKTPAFLTYQSYRIGWTIRHAKYPLKHELSVTGRATPISQSDTICMVSVIWLVFLLRRISFRDTAIWHTPLFLLEADHWETL